MNRSNVMVAGLALAAVSHVQAALVFDAGPSAVEQTFLAGDYAAGVEFTLDAALTVDGLGYFDLDSNGLAEAREVGLWDLDQNLLAVTTVTGASTRVASASTLGSWLVEQIVPLTLEAGTYRIAGRVGSDGVADSNAPSGNRTAIADATLSSGYVRTAFPGGGFAFPTESFSAEPLRVTLTSGEFAPIPVPASLLLLGPGVIALGAIRRRV